MLEKEEENPFTFSRMAYQTVSYKRNFRNYRNSRNSRNSRNFHTSRNYRKSCSLHGVKDCENCDPDAGYRECVYCRDDGGSFFNKNGQIMIGRHHVKNCCKAFESRKKKEESKKKTTILKRVSANADAVMNLSKNPFNVVNLIEEDEKFEKAEAAKKIPTKTDTGKKVKMGWLKAVSSSPTTTKEPKYSPKRIVELKKEAKKPLISEAVIKPFKKKNVLSFEEVSKKFSNTDSWGDSDDDF